MHITMPFMAADVFRRNKGSENPTPRITILRMISVQRMAKYSLASVQRGFSRRTLILMISAETGEGIDAFKAELTALIAKGNDLRTVKLRADNGAALAWLHGRGVVSGQYIDGDMVSVDVSLSCHLWGQFEKQFEKQREQGETEA